uniref:Uncharacterized protein n=1 Tax=Glossina austeni TaxID=7395 RepID=A0A1A9USB0_GLOAU
MQPVQPPTRQFCTADEGHALALMELDMGAATSSLIIENLTSNSGRTRDAIKKRRQTATYKAIMEKLRAGRAAVQEEEEEISTAETHASEVPQETLALEITQQKEIPAVTSAHRTKRSLPALNAETNAAFAPTGEADKKNDNSALIAAIIGLNLDEHDDAVRQQILSSTADQPRELDEWTSVLIASLAKPNRPTKHRKIYSRSSKEKTDGLYTYQNALNPHTQNLLQLMSYNHERNPSDGLSIVQCTCPFRVRFLRILQNVFFSENVTNYS